MMDGCCCRLGLVVHVGQEAGVHGIVGVIVVNMGGLERLSHCCRKRSLGFVLCCVLMVGWLMAVLRA